MSKDYLTLWAHKLMTKPYYKALRMFRYQKYQQDIESRILIQRLQKFMFPRVLDMIKFNEALKIYE